MKLGLSVGLDNTSGDHVILNRVYTFLIVASLLGASDQSRYLDRTAFIPECYPFFPPAKYLIHAPRSSHVLLLHAIHPIRPTV